MPILNIADARRSRNISQMAMSRHLNCSIGAYRNKEKYISPFNAPEMAKFLEITQYDYKDINFLCPKRVITMTRTTPIAFKEV